MKFRSTLSAVLAVGICVSMAGFAYVGKSYSQIDPEGAAQDVKNHDGYFSLKQVRTGTAKLIMRSHGVPSPVQFSTSTSQTKCDSFSAPESVQDGGHGVLLPWIAKLTAGRGFIEKELAPMQAIQIRANTNYVSSTGTGGTIRGACGPIVLRFTPQANRAYLARFMYPGETCKLVVEDATDPDSPIEVNAERINGCPKS